MGDQEKARGWIDQNDERLGWTCIDYVMNKVKRSLVIVNYFFSSSQA